MNTHIISTTSDFRRLPVRFGALTVAVFGLVLSGQARADWAVKDRELIKNSGEQWKKENEKREQIRTETNERLDSLRNIGNYTSAGEQFKEAEGDEKLPGNDAPSATQDLKVENFCKAPESTGGVQSKQYDLCQELVKTQRAQYTYSMKVYENTKVRYEAFKKIQEERSGIGASDAGKLADNTNKLVALLTLMEIDKQQSDSYMRAYSARVDYLNKSMQHLSKQAIDGNPGSAEGFIGDTIGKAAAVGVLGAALETLKSNKRQFGN